MAVKGVLWHSTGANNPNIKRYVQPSDNAADRDAMLALLGVNKSKNDWNHTNRQCGMNCFIGKLADGSIATVQTMPWDYKPWGCGSGSKGSCNNGWIQFEICEDNLKNEEYFNAVYREGVEITAYLCKMFNIDPFGTVNYKGVSVPTILCHSDSHKLKLGGNHGDVYHWFKKYGKTMEDVRKDVHALLNNGSVANNSTVTQEQSYKPTVREWQLAAIADGFKFPEYGVDGLWGRECEAVAKKAVVKKRLIYTYQNLTKIVQKVVGVSADGKCGKNTDAAIKAWQAANGLTADGAVGLMSWRKILT